MKKPTAKIALPALLLMVFLALASACPESPQPELPAEPVILAGCESDAECAAGKSCHHGLCAVEAPTSTVTYGLIVTPPNNSSVAATRIAPAVHAVEGASFQLPAGTVLRGTMETTAGEPATDGTLIARSTNHATSPSLQAPVRDGEFEIRLPPGPHALTFVVDDPRWPRIPLSTVDAAQESELSLTIPQFSELRIVTGRVTRSALDLLDLLSFPVEGAQIMAEGSTTGYRSPLATSDEDGRFTLVLPPGESLFDVLVFSGPDAPLIPHVSFSQAISANTSELSLSLGEWLLETLSVAVDLVTAPVEGQSPQWERLRMDIRSELGLGELLLTPPVVDGRVETPLLVGRYDIEISTPPGFPWGSTTHQTGLLNTLTGIEIELPRRPHVQGRLLDPSGAPLPGASLTIAPTQGTGFPVRLRTGDDGSFETWLDPGTYDLFARPADLAHGPNHHERFSVETGSEALTLTATIPDGFVAAGLVRDENGEPLPDATLQAYQLLPSGQKQILAEGRTRSDGSFRFLFPLNVFTAD